MAIETCAFCQKAVSHETAVEGGWQPLYWQGKTCVFRAVCPPCTTKHLTLNTATGDFQARTLPRQVLCVAAVTVVGLVLASLASEPQQAAVSASEPPQQETTVTDHRPACKALFGQIREKWGNGWKNLGDDLKRAIVAERVLHSFAGADRITPEIISARLKAMHDYCGLGE